MPKQFFIKEKNHLKDQKKSLSGARTLRLEYAEDEQSKKDHLTVILISDIKIQ
ncbi:MAG: hypothetical protein M0P10_11490 [Sphaerochaetaceae bacterium]|nr:hypothetical protein [Sphaerochaetaceae bacterium]